MEPNTSNTNTNSASTQSLHESASWVPFQEAAVPEFLKNGWLLSYGPHDVLVGWGPLREVDGPTETSGTCTLYAPDFYLRQSQPWLVSPNWAIVNRNLLISLVMNVTGTNVNANIASDQASQPERVQEFQWVEPDRLGFEAQFKEIRRGMSERGLKKAVPVVFERAQFGSQANQNGPVQFNSSARARLILKILNMVEARRADSNNARRADSNNARRADSNEALQVGINGVERPDLGAALYAYGFWCSENEKSTSFSEGMLGATPEILFSITGTKTDRTTESAMRIQTVALAGTRARGDGAAEALMSDQKERHEHQLVVDDIRQVLEKLGKVTVGTTAVVEFPALLHLKTPLRADLDRPVEMHELIQVLHPTPALGVAPRELGFTEIERWDSPQLRKRFGAPFGVSAKLQDGTSIKECVVAIRNIQWHDGTVFLGSGCGVVPASDLNREWQELKLKRDSVKRMLDI
jgi:menaquinone-specific isochorismate synthase